MLKGGNLLVTMVLVVLSGSAVLVAPNGSRQGASGQNARIRVAEFKLSPREEDEVLRLCTQVTGKTGDYCQCFSGFIQVSLTREEYQRWRVSVLRKTPLDSATKEKFDREIIKRCEDLTHPAD